MARHPGRVRTITADNGTEFHWFGQIEAVHPVKYYLATPHHSWERGTNENTTNHCCTSKLSLSVRLIAEKTLRNDEEVNMRCD
jgi:IS30 family transposase